MVEETRTDQLRRFAIDLEVDEFEVHNAAVSLDTRQDGEPVTRITVLVSDPSPGMDTWDFDAVRALKRDLARKATALDLPSVSVTLVPDSEAELVDAFAR